MRFIAALSMPFLFLPQLAAAAVYLQGSFTATITSGFHSEGCCGAPYEQVTDLTGKVMQVQFYIAPEYNGLSGTYPNRGSATNQIGPGYWDWDGNWTASKDGLVVSFGGSQWNQGSGDNWDISWSNITKTGTGSYYYSNAYAFVTESYYYTISNMVYFAAVPEPESWSLMITGFLLVGCTVRGLRRAPSLAGADRKSGSRNPCQSA